MSLCVNQLMESGDMGSCGVEMLLCICVTGATVSSVPTATDRESTISHPLVVKRRLLFLLLLFWNLVDQNISMQPALKRLTADHQGE
jgi:hypothetical protein